MSETETTPQWLTEGQSYRILRCAWFDQSLKVPGCDTARWRHYPHKRRARMVTNDGKPIAVLSPGWWNLEAGPDFRNAAIRFGPKGCVKGDIEVHLHMSDWTKHGHDHDPAYNGVILHVCLWNDMPEGERLTVQNAAGLGVPTLTLEPYWATPLAEV